MRIRKAQPDDLETVWFLEQESFPEEAWPREVFERELEDPRALYLLAETDRHPAGYIACWMEKEERYAHITSLAVHPDLQRQGIAAALLQDLLSRCRSAGILFFRAETRISNGHVITLFRRHGFIEAGLLKGYYRSPREDAVLLLKKGTAD